MGHDDDVQDPLIADEEESLDLETKLPVPDAVLGEGDCDEDQQLEELQPTFATPPLPLPAMIEAVIFASPRPLRPAEITDVLSDFASRQQIEDELARMLEESKSRQGGFRLEQIGKLGYQYRTVPELASVMEKQYASRPRPLSRAALETLAIIAFRQPVTRAEIEFIRGVDAGGMMKSLLDRNLITCVGRKEEAGRPMLFGTTDEFLKVFGLGSLKDLPPVESFQPPPELLQNAQEKLDENDSVDVDGFIAGSDDDLSFESSEAQESTGDTQEPDDIVGEAVTELLATSSVEIDPEPESY